MLLLYFFKYRAHSRRAPPKPVIDLLYLISIIISASINQKKQQRRKRSFMKRQANAVRSSNLAFNIEMQNPDLARKANHC
jgi:menaquinone-dependent protoporphyrinogen IX oxidase